MLKKLVKDLVELGVEVAGLGRAHPVLGFGAGCGSINVAVDAQGIALERMYGRTILSSFYAAFQRRRRGGRGRGFARRPNRRQAACAPGSARARADGGYARPRSGSQAWHANLAARSAHGAE